MSTPISTSIHRSRARRDYASGRIDFDGINAEALGWCWSCHADIFEIEPR